jgi:SAM-dependent methyltransferase
MIETWSQGAADANMPEAMLVQTLAQVRRHPWWLARARLALAVLRAQGIAPPAPVFDIGCGWGVNLQALEQAGYRATGLDISRQILALIDRPDRRLVEVDLNQPSGAAHELCAGALLLDVMEHLDDDRGALQRIAPLVQPGGTLVVSVPALPDLFSEFDQIQGHRRRYVPETLRAAFVDSGFAVQKILWWGGWMVPVLRRMRQKTVRIGQTTPKTYADYLRLPPWPVPLVMQGLYAWEHRRALREKLSQGTSLFAVARRNP